MSVDDRYARQGDDVGAVVSALKNVDRFVHPDEHQTDRERRLQLVVSKIETAVEMTNAHAFYQTPRERYGSWRANTTDVLLAIHVAVDDATTDSSISKNVDGELEYYQVVYTLYSGPPRYD